MSETSILIVDDETAFADITAKRLGQRGFSVITANDGPQAIRIIEENDGLDVVLLDVKMPGMDGLEVLKAIMDVKPILRVVLLTGHGTVESAVRGIKLGAFDYLLKPAEIDALTAKLNAAAAEKREIEQKIMDIRIHPYITQEEKDAQIEAILSRRQSEE